MMTSDSEAEYKYSSSNFVQVKANYVSQCPDGELRCVNGHCITISQLCDKVTPFFSETLIFKQFFFYFVKKKYFFYESKLYYRLLTVQMVPMKQCAHTNSF